MFAIYNNDNCLKYLIYNYPISNKATNYFPKGVLSNMINIFWRMLLYKLEKIIKFMFYFEKMILFIQVVNNFKEIVYTKSPSEKTQIGSFVLNFI